MPNALIVIDVQNDFCPGGALTVPEGDQIVGQINAMMQDFDAVILTQDWLQWRNPLNRIWIRTWRRCWLRCRAVVWASSGFAGAAGKPGTWRGIPVCGQPRAFIPQKWKII